LVVLPLQLNKFSFYCISEYTSPTAYIAQGSVDIQRLLIFYNILMKGISCQNNTLLCSTTAQTTFKKIYAKLLPTFRTNVSAGLAHLNTIFFNLHLGAWTCTDTRAGIYHKVV